MTDVKVALVTAFPRDPESPRGGVEVVSVVLARALADQCGRLDVHIVTTDRTARTLEHSTWEGMTIHRLPWTARRIFSGATGADGRRVREYTAGLKPDVVHANDVYGVMVRGLKTPRILTIHGFIHADTLVSGERWAWLRSRIWRRTEHATWASFPRIISISPYVRERLTGIATGSIHDIDNPIANRFFEIPRRVIPGRIFSAATIYPRKNTLGLVEAFARVARVRSDATLHLAGSHPLPAYADKVRARIQALGLTDRVTMSSSLTTSEVCRELSEASVAALVSLEENSPLTVQEAMAAGVPVVTSNRCGMPYLVVDGETGFLVDPHDPEVIADRLRRLLDNQVLCANFGSRASAIARERFRPAVVARRTTAVYEQAASSPIDTEPAAVPISVGQPRPQSGR